MTRSPRQQPYARRGSILGDVVNVEAQLAAYRIATYQPRTKEAWMSALDALGLEPKQREEVLALLREKWNAEPYDPALFDDARSTR